MTMKEIYRPSFWFQLCLASVVSILVYNASVSAEDAEDWMPDPILHQVVRDKLGIPDGVRMTLHDLLRLRDLITKDNRIESLEGLQNAVNLHFLSVCCSKISDLTPLAELKNLHTLKVYNNQISDISPLAGLIGLQELQLQNNFISDLTPLANLQNLSVLRLHGNQISDISPLSGLTGLQELILAGNFISDFTPLVSLTNLQKLHIYPNPIPLGNQFVGLDASHLKALEKKFICEQPRPLYVAPVAERINSRDYPSVFLTHKRSNFDDDPDPFQQLVQYDFSFMPEPFYPLSNPLTFNSPFGGAVRSRNWFFYNSGLNTIERLSQVHRDAISENPNMIFIVAIGYYDGRGFNLSDDSPYWFRNPDGSIARRLWKVDHLGNQYWERLLNFTHPEVIELIIQHAVAIAKCGLYDGIWLDRWHPDFGGELSHLVTPEAERDARIKILQGIRANVREDFLIMVNTRNEIPHFAPHVNGVFVEAHEPQPNYTHKDLYRFENLIKWYESNLRKPSFTLLWGQVDHKPPITQQTVRQFTTLSLTHSDGYVNVSSGHPDIRTLWYDFWDAPLGRPVGSDETKAQLYENREGLFIREYTNGWAVYNRSGQEQQIKFSESTIGVSSGIKGQAHTLPDLDGEIYLKSTENVADLNNDSIVNILDLVIVANAFGKAEPDLNGDGVVNILDLVIVANAF